MRGILCFWGGLLLVRSFLIRFGLIEKLQSSFGQLVRSGLMGEIMFAWLLHEKIIFFVMFLINLIDKEGNVCSGGLWAHIERKHFSSCQKQGF